MKKKQKDVNIEQPVIDIYAGTGYIENDGKEFVNLKTVGRKQFTKKLKTPIFIFTTCILVTILIAFLVGMGVTVNTEDAIIVSGSELYYLKSDNGYIYNMTSFNDRYLNRINTFNSYYPTISRGSICWSVVKGLSEDIGVYSKHRFTPGAPDIKLFDEAGSFLQAERGILYFAVKGDIYSVKADGTDECQKLTDGSYQTIKALIVHDGSLYYNADNRIYSMYVDGSNKSLLSEDDGMYLCVEDNKLYYITNEDDSSSNALYMINTDGSEHEYICSDPGVVLGMSIDSGWIYFTNRYDKNRIYRIHLDGKDLMRLSKHRTFEKYVPRVTNGYIYYVNIGNGNKLYKLAPDGSSDDMIITR